MTPTQFLAAYSRLAKTVAEGLLSGALSEAECKRFPWLGCFGYHIEARIIRVNRHRYARVTLVETLTDDALLVQDFSEPVIAA